MAAVGRPHTFGCATIARSPQIYDERGVVTTLWAGRTFEVGLRLEGTGLLRLPYVALSDRPAFAVAYVDGPLTTAALGAADGLEIRYRIRCRGAGVARFEGVAVQIADFQGFFYHAAFVPGVVVYRFSPCWLKAAIPRRL